MIGVYYKIYVKIRFLRKTQNTSAYASVSGPLGHWKSVFSIRHYVTSPPPHPH